jgi:hypothetical protein
MTKIPESVRNAWTDRQGPVTFATVNAKGIPNIIYATCVSMHDDNTVVVADNYFQKTRQNIQLGSQGSILFITKDNKAFQVKGPLTYYTEGEIFDAMKQWNPEEHPGHAAVALTVTEVYSGAVQLA